MVRPGVPHPPSLGRLLGPYLGIGQCPASRTGRRLGWTETFTGVGHRLDQPMAIEPVSAGPRTRHSSCGAVGWVGKRGRGERSFESRFLRSGWSTPAHRCRRLPRATTGPRSYRRSWPGKADAGAQVSEASDASEPGRPGDAVGAKGSSTASRLNSDSSGHPARREAK